MSAIVIRIMQETVPLDYASTAVVAAAAAKSTGPAGWYEELESERVNCRRMVRWERRLCVPCPGVPVATPTSKRISLCVRRPPSPSPSLATTTTTTSRFKSLVDTPRVRRRYTAAISHKCRALLWRAAKKRWRRYWRQSRSIMQLRQVHMRHSHTSLLLCQLHTHLGSLPIPRCLCAASLQAGEIQFCTPRPSFSNAMHSPYASLTAGLSYSPWVRPSHPSHGFTWPLV